MCYLVSFILAGQGDDGWTNILYIVVLAVFWIVGGIIKATSKKPEAGRKQQSSSQPIRRPVPTKSSRPSAARPTTRTSPDRPRTDWQTARKASAKPRSRLERLAAEFEKALEPYISDIPSKPKSQPKPIVRKPVDLPKDVRLGQMVVRPELPKTTPETEHLPELVFDYADPDELTKAILYYEILGPPISLRDMSH